jgi:ubiquinone/menaquinone biosynthesis C-methylase UbiE/uncharacterized protein YbaR (Trm112 family)
MAFLREQTAAARNTVEDIMIAYDFQAGSYIAAYECNPTYLESYTSELASLFRRLGPMSSALEAGVGEATTLSLLAGKLDKTITWRGFDVSWSRVRLGKDFAQKRGVTADLFCGDLFKIPLEDGSVDVVYTSHSIEPNGGREREAIRELARVARKWVVLLEPAHELASPEAQARMEKHGYVRGLPQAIVDEGLELVEHRTFPVCANPLNPTGLYVVRVPSNPERRRGGYMCPVSGTALQSGQHTYFAPTAFLAYPVLDGVPCLLPANAILATKYSPTPQGD